MEPIELARWQQVFESWIVAAGAGDAAHDPAHVRRVVANATWLGRTESAAAEVVLPAAWLHDCVIVPKSSPERKQASRLAAAEAVRRLREAGYPAAFHARIAHAVEAHSFSAGIAPASLEAKIVQDADRLDAIGMIGVARCFYTAGRMGSALYDPEDPRAERRPLDDAAYALDHFRTKLLKLKDGFQTETGAAFAAERTRRIAEFVVLFETEIGAISS